MLNKVNKRRGVLLASGVSLVLLSACAEITPWVKPYERQHFADPLMAPDRLGIADTYLGHVYDAREGARGAKSSGGGGCGCN